MRTMLKLVRVALLIVVVGGTRSISGQVPPQAVQQLQEVVGTRAETAVILGGDYSAAGGIYTFRGGKIAELSVAKIGGGGEVAAKMPLGIWDMEWAPVLLGNVGHFTADNEFQTGYLSGNRLEYDVLAVQGGAGAKFYLTDKFSLTPTLSGIYGHVENSFTALNPNGSALQGQFGGTLVDWTAETWTVQPTLDADYEWQWRRMTVGLSSRYNFFHTESFSATTPIVTVNGNSHTWENKVDLDVPLGWKLLGGELHTGGFFSRTELFGGIESGLNSGHIYTVNGRLVLDLLGKVWKTQWVGFGASYFFTDSFSGWSAGLDIRLQF